MERTSERFFLTGSLRSGTTLLRLLLGHHPDICTCDEMEFVAEYYLDHEPAISMEAYWAYLEFERNFRMTDFEIDKSLDFYELADSFLMQQRERSGGARVVGATVHHAFSVLPSIYPDARYIHLLRDPREVAQSCVKMGWAGNAYYGVGTWQRAQQQWALLQERVPASHRLEVRFEDLVRDSDQVLTEICNFLGVTYTEEMLEIDKDTTYSRPNPAEAKSWRDFPSHIVRQVEARLGAQTLRAEGYALSDYPALSSSGLMRGWLKVDNILNRILFRIRRYGFWLWLKGVISRRLPGDSLERSVQLEIDAIDSAFLK